jgi:methyltransferase (TIGR00027 family)
MDNPIAKTAWYCCGARALDARSARPVCGDHLAERFMDAEAQAVFQRFMRFKGPNASNAARHRIVDDLLRERLKARPELPVFVLGAGFDTRAFRLPGGRWVEIDQPALIALKDRKLPATEAPNPLQRVPIDFTREALADKLAPWAGTEGAVVVLEGVSMYLHDAQMRDNARTLRRLLPGHQLICDLMDSRCLRRYSQPMRKVIQQLGGDFAPAHDDPAAFVESLGYRRLADFSIVGRAVEHGSVALPRWLLNGLLRSLRDGYRVYVFEAQ